MGPSLQLQSISVSASPSLPPLLRTPIPGPRSRALAARLAEVESRNVTCVEPTPPIFWERAAGSNVWDVDGNRYVDLTAGFGVANTGHAHPRVVEAVVDQSERLLHAMGDVHPADAKVALLEALTRRFPGGGPARGVLGSSGSDAVETAIKTALVATGRPGLVAFEGAYHGLGFGALDATWRPLFREPFAARLPGATVFADFGDADGVRRAAESCPVPVGAVLVEPIQGRGGERIPPDGFLAGLRALCDAEGWLLIADEVYTGFGRTGRWFACDHEGVVPDLICVAKGLSSGMPISACLGRSVVMDAWPPSGGEALHTQTFLGHPPGCAAALASLAVIEEEKLVERAAETGARALVHLRARLSGVAGVADIRGRGLLLGIECDGPERAARTCAGALERGVIALSSGDDARVVSVTPPLSIETSILEPALDVLAEAIG
jgi:4-aminobutyrate aminotransferase/(S)-3-amino-2-methylpropionate transaminase